MAFLTHKTRSIPTHSQLKNRILTVQADNFEAVTLEVFHYQAEHNGLYAHFLDLLGRSPASVQSVADIPFLPISFFKNYDIQSGQDWTAEAIFSSSGTTGQTTSRHFVRSTDWYDQICLQAFAHFYGPVEQFAILALLPSYLERSDSSLVHMADQFIRQSKHSQSGFFLYNTGELREVLADCRRKDIPCILLGVSFALLDLAEENIRLPEEVVVMETGGMKGRRKEIIREELHKLLTKGFGQTHIHSEYGMTELLSQAYSKGKGIFHCPPSMRVLSRELGDPLSLEKPGRTGVLNIIDLANIDSCSFLATDDLGRVHEDGSFEVLGRLDNSDVRGCNLMVW
ncbi:MAG: acyl transferase [Bacteroidota bacterium]